jgi:hypothetical protein
MKKALALMFALSLVAVVSAPAMADVANKNFIITFGTGLSGGTCSYGLSNNVYMSYVQSNNGQNYALGDKHMNGNREYYTTNNTTIIYYFENDLWKGMTTLNSAAALDPTATTISGGTPL